MGYFDNIKFNDIKVGTPSSTPSATPSFQQKVEANRARLIAPTPAPTPQPAPAPSVPLQPMVQEPKTGMGKVFSWLNKPSEWTQSLLTGGKTYEQAFADKNSGFNKFNQFAMKVNPIRLIPGVAKKQDENWNKAMENETARKVGGAAWRMVADPLNFIPFGKIGGLIGKGASKVDDVLKLTEFGDKIIDTARNTPKVANLIEKFNPYFRNPEFGKLMKGSEEITNKRLNDLYKLIKKTAENMSPAEQTRIGQILEGGIDTSAKYEKLAAPLRDLTEKIGKEAVDLGILSRQSFNKYRGAYMKHIFEKYMDNAANRGFLNLKKTAPMIGGQFSKARKGTEGYIREFAAPTFAGLGAGIKDIETAKFYKRIIKDFGIDTKPTISGKSLANDLLNYLSKSYKAPKPGLGIQGYKESAAYKESLMPFIDWLEKKIPASVTEKGLRMETTMGGGKSKVIKGIEKIFGVGTPQYKYPTVPGKSDVIDILKEGAIKFGKVGELPTKRSTIKLAVEKFARKDIPEGYQLASEAITNSKVAKLFKNKALPNSIIDYINRTSEVKKVTGWDKMLNAWKAGKTIYNPAYHVRNVVSNQILSDMSTGRGLVQTVSDYVGAVRQYIGKGNQKFVNAAEVIGLIKQKRFGAALDEFLDTAKVVEQSRGAKILDFPRKLQTVTEETSKLNVFKTWVEKLAKQAGKSVDDALKDAEIVKNAAGKAEEAIFSPYRLSQTERGLAKDLIPFYSFTRQVIPFTAKTLVNNPARLAKYGKMKREVENFSQDQARPGYAENFIRLPWKNKQGENAYLDPTYIYPFGNVFESGERGKLPFGLGFNPIFTEIAQQMANKDFYYDQPITKYESDAMKGKNFMTRAGHAFRTAAPQFVNNAISKIFPAATGKKDFAGRDRNLVQALADTIMGIKTSFINEDKGVLDQFWQVSNIRRAQQNDIKTIMQDDTISDDEKRQLIEKILQ